MPVVYDDLGIRFLFPENWSLEADDEIPDRPSVTVYSPGGAFWTVVRRGPSDDLEQMAEEAAAAIRKNTRGPIPNQSAKPWATWNYTATT